MGRVFNSVVFDGKAPDLSEVAEKITEITTLAVSIQHLGPEEKDSSADDAYLAFACAPKERFGIHVRRGLIDRHSGTAEVAMAMGVQEPVPDSETQVVCLESYVGQECTIWYATLLALEALGGRPKPPIKKEERQKYGRPITASQLKKRRRMELVFSWIFLALTLPVTIPFYLVYLFFFMVFLAILSPFAFVICLLWQKRIENWLSLKSNKKGEGDRRRLLTT